MFRHPNLLELSVRYSSLLQDNIFMDWNKHHQQLSKKLDKFKSRYKKKSQNAVHIPDSIKFKDDDLKEYASNINFTKKPNFVTYGDFVLDTDEIAYLNIPVKDRAIERVNIRDIRLELDRVAAKLRYGMMNENDNDDDQDQEHCQEPINIPFDRRTMTVNLSGIPVTDFQYNTRVMPPKVGSGDQELSIQLMKSEVLRASSMFCKSKCDESGTLKNMTLSRSEVRGRTKLLKRVKDSEMVLSSTDKSGKIAVWSRDLYLEAAQEHITKDDLVNQELVNKFENQANGLATATCNAFNLGSEREQQDRVSKAMKVFDVPPPNVFFLAKDHKDIPIIPSGRIYPKTRGVCGAKTGPISRLQNLYSLALGFSADALKAPLNAIAPKL